ncbi:hypothetical protein KO494_11225 [Lacinutrix sp. C3R15]|uniref:hypothetical protein n=1 Tax=Flavobacteriaceae TaxID=49546 RepID=UPI001C0A51B1|nr:MULTISPECIES: hypothetical protein [Flavobacteriaceae]MBU2940109.1 hypothetical protein [Lacinutrix sp. C3R15]MDO6623426.1 hypothetical protein [Oceanihabitans sp. 1_MG-2023]
MKTLKKTIGLVLFLLLLTNYTNAQDMYLVHQDNVKPSMVWEYEEVAKEFNQACVDNNPQTSWITVSTSDFVYLYVTPIENFAEIDNTPFKDMAEKMGDKWNSMFDRFDTCYDSHSDYVVMLDRELSYMPNGITQTQEGENYRDYIYIYYKPENAKKIKEGIKAIKTMYADKGSKSYYRIYKSDFGTSQNYYMVAISSKDDIDSAQKSKATRELLGPERFEVFKKLMNYATRMESTTAEMRPDLAYSPK